MKKHLISLIVISFALSIFSIPVFSQEAKQEQVPAAGAPPIAAPAEEAPKINELSIYGEVQNINPQTSTIAIQYYDYDNDEEKTIEITVNKDSKLENVKATEEIKKGDWADITYVVADGKNMAKLVSVEKEEPAQEENAPAPAEE